ncbi:aldehyde dehydrogenase [Desulfitobacterium sp. THU1]|uniref:aldehyde dehydrogenase n=1 Tax=Desulfitobacterium sp. THU1 TaxID=3138072 RepID=UPI00311F9397
MSDVKEIILKQRRYFEEGKTKDLNFRMEKLRVLRKVIIENEEEIREALHKDLNKTPFEAYATEVGIVLEELSYTLKHLPKWVKRKRVRTPITQFLATSFTYPEPHGITLIMSPWNYPFQLAMAPLIGAIAAGNCSVIKPSEYSFNTSVVIEKLIKENFKEEFITVVRGGREANKTLLDEKFDHIFFTGSVAVGKTVMEAASKHLTPVTLELGGKSPCIVDETANIDLAAKRIMWGKLLNSGQTCVAPDYLLVHSSIKSKLIDKMKEYVIEFYGKNPSKNEDYPKIINEKHFKRLQSLIIGEEIVFGGQFNEETHQISPTIVHNITWDSPVMLEEIFGPILPVLEFEHLSEVISQVNKHPKPLALYFFTTKKEREEQILRDISFGGGCINDTIVHLATSYMPFGGVGESGMGGYHGKASFDTFSHQKSIMKRSNLLDIPLRYPPFKNKLSLVKKVMR